MMNWIEKIAALQDRRILWVLMAIIGIGLALTSFLVFQRWLYLRPCEQCVYIRFAMACLAVGGAVGAINPRVLVLKLAGYSAAVYGAAKGIGYSLALIRIGEAYRSGNLFGVQGCSAEPAFPFHLPLHSWFPTTFLPTEDCGVSYPIIPEGAVLSPMQKYFTDLYRDGWYLIPSRQFMTMEQCTLLCFSLILTALLICLICWTIVQAGNRRRP